MYIFFHQSRTFTILNKQVLSEYSTKSTPTILTFNRFGQFTRSISRRKSTLLLRLIWIINCNLYTTYTESLKLEISLLIPTSSGFSKDRWTVQLANQTRTVLICKNLLWLCFYQKYSKLFSKRCRDSSRFQKIAFQNKFRLNCLMSY